ncbi:MAG: hypothetical protein AAFY36_08745 [Bacteroidota bacterium]
MRNFSHLLLVLAGLYLFLFNTGCGEEGAGDGTALPPEIQLESGAGIISSTTDLPLGDPFTVRVRLDDGDALLRSLAISRDGINVPFGDLTFDGGSLTSNNPFLIPGGSASGVTYDITITPSTPSVGANTYLFTVTDEDNQFASVGLTINYTDAGDPTAVLEDDAGFISGDATLTTSNENFDVRVTLDDNGTNPITSLSISEDGSLLPANNLEFLNQTFDPANPLALISSEQQGVSFDIRVTPTSTSQGTRSYTFEVTDDRGATGSVTINITFEGTNLENTLMGVLFNQGGGVGTGGLDLDTGTGTGSNDAAAEIQDEGIDTDIVVANNWRRQISAANDAVLREVNLSALPDGFSFASVITQEQIIAAYDTGDTPDGDDSSCNCTDTVSNEEVSDVSVGDLFAVLRGGRYYLIEIVEVNNVVDDPGTPENENNDDNYVVNIKY